MPGNKSRTRLTEDRLNSVVGPTNKALIYRVQAVARLVIVARRLSAGPCASILFRPCSTGSGARALNVLDRRAVIGAPRGRSPNLRFLVECHADPAYGGAH